MLVSCAGLVNRWPLQGARDSAGSLWRYGEMNARFMRFLCCVFALFCLAAAPAMARQADPSARVAQSRHLIEAGQAAMRVGNYALATDRFESAAAADPANQDVFTHLGQAALKQGLAGKALHYYRLALQIAPNDLAALEGQSEALIARGALKLAEKNLARIEKICPSPCAASARVSVLLAGAQASGAGPEQGAKKARDQDTAKASAQSTAPANEQ